MKDTGTVNFNKAGVFTLFRGGSEVGTANILLVVEYYY